MTDTFKRTRATVCPIRTAAQRLVVERGHLGITNVLLQSASQRTCTHVGTVLSKMTHNGALVPAKVPGHAVHWFANTELAQRWIASTPPVPKADPTQRQHPPVWRSVHAPVTLAPSADTRDTPVTHPAHVRVQRGPGELYDPRYQCAPGERPYGAGFAAAGIGRDVTTGQQWGQQA